MIVGFVGIGDGYNFIPKEFIAGGFLATFLAAVAYAGSGGNLLLANSFYVLEEKKGQKTTDVREGVKNIFKQNLLFF